MQKGSGGSCEDEKMKANDIIFQSEKFLCWHGRTGGDLETNFRWWAQGKAFWPEDEVSILAAAKAPESVGAEELVTCGEG